MTLEDFIPKTEDEVKGAFKRIAEYLDSKEQEELESLSSLFSGFSASLKEFCAAQEKTNVLLQKLLDKEDAEVEFPAVQQVTMDKPDWYIEPKEDDKTWVTNLLNSLRYDGDKTRAVLKQILEKEAVEVISQEKGIEPAKTVNTGSLRTRRTTQWRSASTQLGNIIGAFDGVNTIFYMPDSFIPRSETVRLNGGLPLLTDDYSISGNKITFIIAPVSGSTCEVRYQVK